MIAGISTMGAGAGFLISLYSKLTRVEQKLDDHVAWETGKYEDMRVYMEEIEKRLPNGELHEALSILRELKLCNMVFDARGEKHGG